MSSRESARGFTPAPEGLVVSWAFAILAEGRRDREIAALLGPAQRALLVVSIALEYNRCRPLVLEQLAQLIHWYAV